MRRFIWLCALMIADCASQKGGDMDQPAKAWATLDGKPPLVIAHRGAPGYRPEHTLEGYALAIDMGADVVEPDLVFTKDHVLAARHDRYLSTTTDVADHPEFTARKRVNDDKSDEENKDRADWWVEDFTLAELKMLRARQAFAGRSTEFDGKFEIPTFDEMLALVERKAQAAGRPVGVYPETKHPSFYASKGYDFEAPLRKALRGFDAGPVFIQSFEPEILKRLKGKANAKLVQLVDLAPDGGPSVPLSEIATYADAVGPAKSLVINENGPTGFVADAHELGLVVHPWTFRNDVPNTALAAWRDNLPKERSEGAYVALDPEWGAKIGAPNDAATELRLFLSTGIDGVFDDFPDTAIVVRKYYEPLPSF